MSKVDNINTPPLGHEVDRKEEVIDHVEYAGGEERIVADEDRTRDIDEGYDPAFVKATIKKVDWRLIPVLAAMYCVSLIDRTNLSLARQANDIYMDTELGTNIGDRYSMITIFFFPPYILLELPSQLGLRKFGARNWLSSAVVLWGIVMLGMGFVETWGQLAGLRALLGVFEAVLFPGAAYLISCWYPRRSMATRNTVFYIISSVVGAFSSPLGYCFTLMHGMRGLSGWRWAFIWYGIITIVVGIVAYFTLVDFPDRATFITQEQKELIQTRIQRDRGDSEHDPVTLRKIGTYAKDWKIWVYAIMFCGSTVASYSLAYFLPMILMSMGFKNVETLVLNAPAQAWSMIPAFTTAYLADKYRNMRGWAIVINAVFLIIGTCMYSQLPMSMKAARFVGIFFAVGGCNSNVPLVLSWAQCSIRSQSKRAYTAALLVAFGGVGGILAGVLFTNKEAPTYKTGVFFTIGINSWTICMCIFLNFYYRHVNKKADKGLVVLENSPGFRYQG